MAKAKSGNHKHFQLDSAKISRAQKALRPKTKTETTERGLDLAIAEHESSRPKPGTGKHPKPSKTHSPCPPTLYKYFPPARIDVLRAGKLRFTQPGVFNDPFECSPSFKISAPFNEMERVSKLEADRNEMPEAMRKHLLSLWKDPHFLEHVDPLITTVMLEMMARGVGVLSLSETADNLLMWAHYAGSHEGFVVGFDTAHPFFDRPDARENAVHDLRPVIYTSKRPSRKYFSQLQLINVYFTKSKEWKYEKEWRMYTIFREQDPTAMLMDMISSLVSTGTVGQLPPMPVNLLDFPSECVSKIIIGCRAKAELWESIREIAGKKYPGAGLYEGRVSKTEFRLLFSDLQSQNAGSAGALLSEDPNI